MSLLVVTNQRLFVTKNEFQNGTHFFLFIKKLYIVNILEVFIFYRKV